MLIDCAEDMAHGWGCWSSDVKLLELLELLELSVLVHCLASSNSSSGLKLQAERPHAAITNPSTSTCKWARPAANRDYIPAYL